MTLILDLLFHTSPNSQIRSNLDQSWGERALSAHEYFRRTLCNLIGKDIAAGLIPNDEKLVGPMIKNICYANAKNYMAFPGVK